MKNRIPRKLKKQIPQGPYCYQGLSYDDETGIYRIKPCPFDSSTRIGDISKEHRESYLEECDENGMNWYEEFKDEHHGWCKYLNYMVDDQCKACGIHCDYRKPRRSWNSRK